MVLSIKSDAADRLARELAAETGESLTQAVTRALRERLDRVRDQSRPGIAQRLGRIREAYAELPVSDDRSPDEIIGYGSAGLPG